jgi:hypothetical protein
MRRAALLLCCLLAGTTAYAQQQPPLSATKPLVEVWRSCAMENLSKFMKSGEPAETIAKVALYECREQRQIVADALHRTSPNIPPTAVLNMEGDIRDYLISLVVQAKSK